MACIIGMMHTACSEDIDGQSSTAESETTSLAINIEGFETGIQTRAGETYNPDDYLVDMYIFSEQKNSPGTGFDSYTFESKKEFGTSRLVTLDNLDKDKNYAFIFVGYEPEYKDKAKARSYDSESFCVGPELKGADSYTSSYVEIFDGMDSWGFTNNGEICPYEKINEADDEYMIYGAAFDWAATEVPNYTPMSVRLTRQMGAVVFRSQIEHDGSSEIGCNIYTRYYRLYLSQILEPKEKSTTNTNDDYIIDESAYIKHTFSAPSRENADGSKDYIIYVPCTTTRSVDELNEYKDEYANQISGFPTSFTINGQTYTTSVPFPVFPNRRTILTLMSDNQLQISFEDANGGVSYDDEWNGWQQ